MTQTFVDRRTAPRTAIGAEIEVIVDGHRHPAQLRDISPTGLNAKLAADVIATGEEVIEAVALNDAPPLRIAVKWGLFDGTFGAAFVDAEAAEAQVDRLFAG